MEEWARFGPDYMSEPIFMNAARNRQNPYEDNGTVGFYSKSRNSETAQLHWWETHEKDDLSDWRKNYMRTLELRTLNAKRMLKVNIQGDMEKVASLNRVKIQAANNEYENDNFQMMGNMTMTRNRHNPRNLTNLKV